MVHFTLFSFLIYFAIASPKTSLCVVQNGRRIKSIPGVDSLIVSMEHEQWKPDDEACLQATLDMLYGVKNDKLWATWIWDSMQPPVGSLYGVRGHGGNYDQCFKAPWSSVAPALRTQYCIVDVMSEAVEETKKFDPFDSAEEYFRTPSKDGRLFNEHHIGVCLPAICQPSAVAKIYRLMHQLTHLPDGDVYVDPRDCIKAGEVLEYSWGFYIFWTLVGVLFATAVFSTVSNYYDDRKQSFLTTITKSFCMKRNYSSLFSVNKEEIKVMNGIRSLTAILIVFLHEASYTIVCPIINSLDIDKTLSDAVGTSLAHLEVLVDTFFAMSGLLLIRSLMLGKQSNVVYALVKRYIRLIGPLALATMYLTSAVMYMGDGPLWRRANRDETDICVDNWWKNVLMVNNDAATLCHIVTWYVSCDFQLAILAAVLFCLFKRNRQLGVTAFVAVSVAVTLHLGLTVYWMKLDIVPFGLKSFFQMLRSHEPLNYTYFKSHSRAGSYLVGMLMGYIVTTYKPADHRNVISKKWSVITTIASVATLTVVLCIGGLMLERPYDPLEAAVVVATNRVFWAVAVCCVIGACEYGCVPLVADLLSWPGFVPLNKLSYCLCLLHPLIIQRQKYSARNAATFAMYTMILNAYGVIVVGYAASLILYLILEAPFINISNALFTVRPTPLKQDCVTKVTEDNGNSAVTHQKECKEYTKAKLS